MALDTARLQDLANNLDSGEQDHSNLSLSLYNASKQDPDQAAQALKLSDVTGLPSDTVIRNFDTVKRDAQLGSIDYNKLQNDSPHLANWLIDPDNAAVSHDDLKPLQDMSEGLSFGQKALNAVAGYDRMVRHAMASPFLSGEQVDELSKHPVRAIQSIASGGLQTVGGLEGIGEQLEGAWNLIPKQYTPPRIPIPGTDGQTFAGPIDALKTVGHGFNLLANMVAPDNMSTAEQIFQGVGQFAPMAALSAYAGPEAALKAALPVFYGMSAHQTYQDAKQHGADDETARAAGAVSGSFTVATEAIALPPLLRQGAGKFIGQIAEKLPKGIIGDVMKYVTKHVGAAVPEGMQEVAEQVQQNLTAQALYDPNRDTLNGAGQSGGVGFGAALLTHMFMGALAHGHMRTLADDDQARLETVNTAAKSSKTLQRSPEKIAALVAKLSENGIKDAYVSPEAFDTYFQSKNIAPEQAAAEILGDPSAYMEAKATGADFAIPMVDYVTKIAATEHADGLREQIKLGEDRLSAAEMDISAQEYADRTAEMYKEMQDETQYLQDNGETADGSHKVFEEVRGQLLATGQNPTVADHNARIVQAFTRIMGKRLGVSPEVFFQSNPIGVNQAIPESLKAVARTDLGIDPLLSDLKAGKFPSANKAYGPSLLEFLASKGGVRDEGGELSTKDLRHEATQRGLLGLVRKGKGKGGLSLDGAREAAVEAGYLRDAGGEGVSQSDIQDLLDAIDSELQGKPVYSEANRNAAIADRLEALQAIGDELDQRGIDVTNTSTEELRKLLTDGVLFQSAPTVQTETPEFNKWFGDSKVVGKDGKPLVVYHGTDGDIEAFNKSNLGSNTGAESAKLGFFFTDDSRTAESYAHYAANDARVQALVREADQAEKKGDFDGYDSKLAEAEALEASQSDPKNRANGQNIVPVYLSIQNPLVVDAKGENAVGFDIPAAIKKAKKSGHDGLIIHNLDDAVGLVDHAANHYVAFSDTQMKSAVGNNGQFDPNNPSILKQGGQTPRAQIRMGQRNAEGIRPFNIDLLKGADRSSFVHEVGHYIFDTLGDYASREGAAPELQADLKNLLDYVGVDSFDKVGVEQHEKVAEAFEQYLFEGKAPSEDLVPVFAKFRSWLLSVYRSLKGLGVKLTPEVRSTFDRLLATEDEINNAHNVQHQEKVFDSPEAAGMTEQEYQKYLSLIEQSNAEEQNRVAVKMLEPIRRATEKWFRKERRRVKAEVQAQLNETQEYRAYHFLRKGRFPGEDTTPEALQDDEGKPLKLDKQSLVDRTGEAFVQEHMRGMYRLEGGVDADLMAPLLGYSSGGQMIEAIANQGNHKQMVEDETDRIMKARHGDPQDEIGSEALNAVMGKPREDVMYRELAAFEKLTGRSGRTMQRRFIKAAAEQTIHAKRLVDIKPIIYQRAAAKAAREAYKAALEGDHDTAYAAKRREILNTALYRKARDARLESESASKQLRGYLEGTRWATLGKAGHDYQDQMAALLDRYNLKSATNKQINAKETLREWVQKKYEEGYEPYLPDSIANDLVETHWRELTYGKLMDLRDTAKSIYKLADLKTSILDGIQKREFAEVRQELIDSAKANFNSRGDLPFSDDSKSFLDSAKENIEHVDALLLKTEQLIEWLDGGNSDGPWARIVFDRITDAQTLENDYTLKISDKISHAVQGMPAEIRKHLHDQVYVPSIGRSMARTELLAMAQNTGTESNLGKLTRGRGWSQSQVDQAIDLLTKQEMDYVQSIWDTLETMWPDIAALQKRVSGVAPPKIEPRLVITRHGTYKGGYYPIVYDPSSKHGERQLEGMASELFEQGYDRATTPQGHTKARIDNFAAPIKLDINVLPAHIAKVVKDLSHREAILAVNKVLTDNDVREALIDTIGKDRYDIQLKGWLRSVANDRNTSISQNLGMVSRMLNSLRTNGAVAVMGFKATTMFSQVAGLSTSLDYVKGKHLSHGVLDFLKNPAAQVRYVQSLSGEMRHRTNNLERDIRDKMRNIRGKTGRLSSIQRTALHGIALFDMTVSYPTWVGAYNQTIAEGKTHEQAIRYADRAVRLTQGSGGAKDLSAIQRNHDTTKLLTMFYSYFNVLYARQRDLGRSVKQKPIQDMPRHIARLLWLIAIPALLGELLAGRGPDDDEDKAQWALRTIAMYPFAAVPVVRGLAENVGSGYDFEFTPMGRFLSKASGARLMIDAYKGKWNKVPADAIDTAGYLFGLPVEQAKITGGYLIDLVTGEDNPDDAAEFLHDFFFHRKK